MDDILAGILQLEKQLDQIDEDIKITGRISEALSSYQEIEQKLVKMDILPVGKPYRERARVLAVCLNRQVLGLRTLKRFKEAGEVSARELEAARQSAHLITLANALLSDGYSRLMNDDLIDGEHALDEACRLYESGDTRAHICGLGSYWSLRAEIIMDDILRYPISEALSAADNSVNAFLRIDDPGNASKAFLLRAKAHRILGEIELAALDTQRAQQLKAKHVDGR